jgi:hypothetical protein
MFVAKRIQTSLLLCHPARAFASKAHFYDVLQLDDIRKDLRESVEKFADEEVKPLAAEMDRTMKFPT